MKQILITIILAGTSLLGMAQVEDIRRVEPLMPAVEELYSDSLIRLPELTMQGKFMPVSPYWGGMGWNTWRLHEGLNLNLGASVMAGFGKHAPKGVGFAQNLSAQYAGTLGKKWTYALGGYLGNINWGRANTREVGLSGVLGYQFNEHWETYIYGQKSLHTTGSNLFYNPAIYHVSELGDRLGAALRYNFNPSVSVQISIEGRSVPDAPLVRRFSETQRH